MQEEKARKVYQELNLQFLAVLDQELILNLAARVIDQNSSFSGLRQIGQGSHFRVYEMTLRKMRVALKVPLTSYSGFENTTTLNKVWNENLNLLKKYACDLVPPFQNYPFAESYLQVMPLFEMKKTTFEVLASLNDEFNKSLAEIGLRNNDALQIGFFKGIPFALDLSDIVKV